MGFRLKADVTEHYRGTAVRPDSLEPPPLEPPLEDPPDDAVPLPPPPPPPDSADAADDEDDEDDEDDPASTGPERDVVAVLAVDVSVVGVDSRGTTRV